MFIEVTAKDGKTNVLISVASILSISKCSDSTACIEVCVDAKGVSTCILAEELFVDIKGKLQKLSQIV